MNLPRIEPTSAVGELAEFYNEAGASLIMQCFSLRPDFGKVMNQAANSIHFRAGSLSRRDHELIATYVSALNHCQFCTDSHAAFLRMHGETDEIARAIAEANLELASTLGLGLQRQIMLEFIKKITYQAYSIETKEVNKLNEIGYNPQQIAEMVYIAALFAFFNRVANSFGIPSLGMIDMSIEEIRNMTSRP